MSHKLLNHIIAQREGMYVHAIEVGTAYELENIIESIHGEYGDQFTADEYYEFFSTAELCYLYDDTSCDVEDRLTQEQQDADEAELYAFDIKAAIYDHID